MQMVPGFSNMPNLQGADGSAKLKAYITIMDSMTDQGILLSFSALCYFFSIRLLVYVWFFL